MVEFLVDGIGYECSSISQIEVGYDASDLKSVTSGRTRVDISLSIVCDAQNWSLLCGDIYPHSYTHFNDSYHSGSLLVDCQTLFDGEAVMSGVEWSGDDIVVSFKILGDTDSWAHTVALSTFNSIPIEYEKQLTDATIRASWVDGSSVLFLPVTRDEVEYDAPSTQSYTIVKVRSVTGYHPFLHVKSLIDAIFSATVYSVESQFMESDMFNRLYISGSYAHSESDTAHTRMGFFVSRDTSASTTAAYGGRVYASPYISYSTVGNLVEISSISSRDDCYSNGGAISLTDGAIQFKALYSTNVGFEFRLAFVATYRIESRDTLSTFNRIYVGDSTQFEFTLANSWVDQRYSSLSANFSYTIVSFDHVEGREYCLFNTSTGAAIVSFSDNYATFTTSTSGGVRLMYLSDGVYILHTGDWAIYSGWISYQGEIEIDVTFTSAPAYMSAGSVRSFDTIFFDGGEQGDSFTLLERTSIRPIFASYPGYGSYFDFEDISRHEISQSDFLTSLQHLFNLRFYTDCAAKKVYIEPRDDFFDDSLWDWSDRVVLSDGVEFSPLAAKVNQTRVWRYQSGEASMEQHLDCSVDEYGVWSASTPSHIAIEGSTTLVNSLLYPSANDDDGILYVGERYDDSTLDTLNITPRIVQRVGYCETSDEGEMPYATFHDGDYTLCFEDRDGLQGLNRYYAEQVALDGRSDEVTLSIYLAPQELNSLFILGNSAVPSIRSRYIISLDGELCRAVIERIDSYDVDSYVARITFVIID